MGKITTLAVLAASLMAATPAVAGPGEDAVATVTSVLDRFNAGDFAAFVAAHRDGAVIIDEFAPFVWGGSGSVEQWGADYGTDAEARGISDGRVDYEAPIQVQSTANTAYIVLPTVYRFKQNGTAMAGKGSMTFTMAKVEGEWKISTWTYNGATPVAE